MKNKGIVILISVVAIALTLITVIYFGFLKGNDKNDINMAVRSIFDNSTELAYNSEGFMDYGNGSDTYARLIKPVMGEGKLTDYISRGNIIDKKNIGKYVNKIEVSEGETGKKVYELYEIDGVSPEFAMAVTTESMEVYVEAINLKYQPEDLKDYINDSGLKYFTRAEIELYLYDENENIKETISYAPEEDKEIYNVVFSDNQDYNGVTDVSDSVGISIRCATSRFGDVFYIVFANGGNSTDIMYRPSTISYEFEYNKDNVIELVNYINDELKKINE